VLYAVILAGGSGTRLWPLSRAGHPKFLHPLTGTSSTLLQATAERLDGLATADTTMVVTGVAHAAAVARQLPDLPDDNILVEPAPRDSCAAIGLAAAIIAEREPTALMGSFASDHLVADVAAFQSVVRAAAVGAQAGKLMTIGITPTRAETGYGYLKCGAVSADSQIRAVEEFAEKPDAERAEAYVRSREYLWNASMFVWRVDVFLNELARQQPELHTGLRRIAAAWHGPRREDRLTEIWPTLKKISVDYAVMEGAAAEGLVATVPGSFGWTDVGDFHTLGDVLPGDAKGNVVLDDAKGEVILHDSADVVVVPRTHRLVAAVGLTDIVIVDTDDALLVCSRGRAQEVKAVVDALRSRGATDYL
jgi:mannose-1-phosphate guanylyltransferase